MYLIVSYTVTQPASISDAICGLCKFKNLLNLNFNKNNDNDKDNDNNDNAFCDYW